MISEVGIEIRGIYTIQFRVDEIFVICCGLPILYVCMYVCM